MKKNKLLMPILGVPALLATTLPAIVSCHDGGGEVDGPEEFVMPELETQETVAGFNNNFGAHQYIVIPNIKLKNPKHIYYGFYAQATPITEVQGVTISLGTDIVPHYDTKTFDVKVLCMGDTRLLEDGTQIDFNLSFYANDPDWETPDEKISGDTKYSLILKTGAICTPNMNYVQKSDSITGNMMCFVMNAPFDEIQFDSCTVSGFEGDFGKVNTKLDGFTNVQNYAEFTLSFDSQHYDTAYEGVDFAANCTLKNTDETETLDVVFNNKAFSVLEFENRQTAAIELTKSSENVYEGSALKEWFVWSNPEQDGQSAAALTWGKFDPTKQDGIKTIEVTDDLSRPSYLNFKITTYNEMSGENPEAILISYKNVKFERPVDVRFRYTN